MEQSPKRFTKRTRRGRQTDPSLYMTESHPEVGATVKRFFEEVASGQIEIYNEFSLQFELGAFFRDQPMGRYKVQFERPVDAFGFARLGFVKKEIDLVLSTLNGDSRIAIEVKFPRQGQYPEQMFSFCKDLRFMEQVVAAGFSSAYLVAVADDRLFYEGDGVGIYSHFRGGAPLGGVIQKPTGSRQESVELSGQYNVAWKAAGHVRYFWLRAQ